LNIGIFISNSDPNAKNAGNCVFSFQRGKFVQSGSQANIPNRKRICSVCSGVHDKGKHLAKIFTYNIQLVIDGQSEVFRCLPCFGHLISRPASSTTTTAIIYRKKILVALIHTFYLTALQFSSNNAWTSFKGILSPVILA
jgi:hypothetical protein